MKLNNPLLHHSTTPVALTFLTIALVVILASGLFSSSPAAGASSTKLTIYVVNYPLQYFAVRIAGEHATVVFPAPADVDPVYWMPDTKTISEYQQADLILLNGANYARWVSKVSLSQFRLVDTSSTFNDQYIYSKEAVTHTHGPGGEHAHESLAFTTWLDLDLAAKQAQSIAKVLSRKKPELKDTFQKNYEALKNDLMSIDREIKKIVLNNQQQPLIASHPVYDYFAQRYGLNMLSVHWEPDEVPNVEQWLELKKILKEHPAKWMVWEGEPLDETVEKLKPLGINSIVFDPCGNVPQRDDFLTVMRQNIKNLELAFE
jgi:zinc transport system substrate-binding protein